MKVSTLKLYFSMLCRTLPVLHSKFLFESIQQVKGIHHFTQDDLMTEDVFVLDCHTSIFVWVGQQVDVKVRLQALDIGEVIIFISMQQL